MSIVFSNWMRSRIWRRRFRQWPGLLEEPCRVARTLQVDWMSSTGPGTQYIRARSVSGGSRPFRIPGSGSTASHGLSLLELSRGIIMRFAVDCRNDVSELCLLHPGCCLFLKTWDLGLSVMMICPEFGGSASASWRRRRSMPPVIIPGTRFATR